jgi:uncharacterized protein YjiS (DUF1127 family)
MAAVLKEKLNNVRSSIREYNLRQTTLRELSSLSDRELSDIGISRYDIPFIVKNL